MQLLGGLRCFMCSRVLGGHVQWRIPGAISACPVTEAKCSFSLATQGLKPAIEEQFLPFLCPSALPPLPKKNTSFYKRKSNKGRYIEAFSTISGFQ